uniref:Uncharacterized protein n=1 Tax=Branchiostoma floridae TaxID=7739 RepID=C3Y200_BRAFL|eukprot:XP_002609880.1 hypothetical protein BRAFLDRAFT_90737 [Branchiostoma floridae]
MQKLPLVAICQLRFTSLRLEADKRPKLKVRRFAEHLQVCLYHPSARALRDVIPPMRATPTRIPQSILAGGGDYDYWDIGVRKIVAGKMRSCWQVMDVDPGVTRGAGTAEMEVVRPQAHPIYVRSYRIPLIYCSITYEYIRDCGAVQPRCGRTAVRTGLAQRAEKGLSESCHS